MLIEKVKIFSKKIKSKILFNYDLKKLNWFNIGGKTKIYFKPENLKDLNLFLTNIFRPVFFVLVAQKVNFFLDRAKLFTRYLAV